MCKLEFGLGTALFQQLKSFLEWIAVQIKKAVSWIDFFFLFLSFFSIKGACFHPYQPRED